LAKGKHLKPEEKEKLNKYLVNAGAMNQKELNECIQDLKIKAPETNNDLSEALPFNLMFET
jgi:glycyl-tRNA synthetase (class II)